MSIHTFIRATSLCVAAALLTGTGMGQAPLVGLVRIPGTASDKSELIGTLETGTPHNAFGGFSAIEYSGEKNRYWLLPDRGPADGASSFLCRFHEIDLMIGVGKGSPTLELVATHLLRSKEGDGFSGSLEMMKSWDGHGHPPSLDPEGIRRLDKSILAVSDEYGPTIDVFDRNGTILESIPIPEHFRLTDHLQPPRTRGTFPNRGMEGLAVTTSGRVLIAAMQGPLVQDGRIEKNKCLGIRTRWLVHDRHTGKAKEWLYTLDDESTGVSEVLAVDDNRFLVLERDSKAGSVAKVKRIYLADASHASDVSEVSSLRDELPEGTQALGKRLLVDLMHSEYGLSGDSTPEKPEGLTWGPPLPDGARLLVVCFDNDFDPARESIIAAFRIDSL
jgi:hypothetical protein